jgi:hypothetical protein
MEQIKTCEICNTKLTPADAFCPKCSRYQRPIDVDKAWKQYLEAKRRFAAGAGTWENWLMDYEVLPPDFKLQFIPYREDF